MHINTQVIQQPASLSSPQRLAPVLHYSQLIKTRDADGRRILCDRYVMLRSIGSGGVATVELCYDLVLRCHLACKKMSKRTLSRQREYAGGGGGGSGSLLDSSRQLSASPIVLPTAAAADATKSPLSTGAIAAQSRPRMQTGLDKVAREIAIMKQCWHPHIVKLHGVIDDPQDDGLYLLMEFCEYGQIMQFDATTMRYRSTTLRTDAQTLGLCVDDLRIVMRHVCAGLKHLHKHLIIHRDLKPDNLLVSLANDDENGAALSSPKPDQIQHARDETISPQLHSTDASNQTSPKPANASAGSAIAPPSSYCVKLGDLGVARQFTSLADPNISDTHGTYAFFSPEMCSGEPYNPFLSDIWGLGMTLAILATGRVPFMTPNQPAQKLFDAIQNQPLELPRDCPIDPQLADLIHRILTKDPLQRLTLQQIELHPFMQAEQQQQQQQDSGSSANPESKVNLVNVAQRPST